MTDMIRIENLATCYFENGAASTLEAFKREILALPPDTPVPQGLNTRRLIAALTGWELAS